MTEPSSKPVDEGQKLVQQSEYYQQKPRPGTVSKEVFLKESKCTQWKPKTYYSFGAAAAEFRFIILVLGPMGSGKSCIVKYMKAYAKILKPGAIRATKGEWIIDAVNHDHFITQSPQYKQEFDTIFPIANADDTNVPAEEQTHQLNNAYQTVRKGREHANNTAAARRHYGFSSAAERRGVADPSTLGDPDKKPATSIQVYENLRTNIKEGNNIVYEATGEGWGTQKNIFETIVRTTDNCAKYKYIVLASMNVIDIDSNKERILSRFIKQKKTYDEWRQGSATPRPPIPRLPYYDRARIEERNKNAYEIIQNMVHLCTHNLKGEPTRLGQCAGVGIDLLFIFDNRGDEVCDNEETLATRSQRKTPIFIIPLSDRSRWITQVGQGKPLTFGPSERTKFTTLMSSFTENKTPFVRPDKSVDTDVHTKMLNIADTREWVAPLLQPPSRRRKQRKSKKRKKKKGGNMTNHSKRGRRSMRRKHKRKKHNTLRQQKRD